MEVVKFLNSELLALIKRARNNHAAFAEIMEIYHPLIEGLTEKYRESFHACGIEREDIKQEAAIALFSAVRTYNLEETERVTFGLYAKICIKNRFISLLRNKTDAEIPFDDSIAEFVGAEASSDPELSVIGRDSYEKLLSAVDNALSAFETDVFKMFLTDKSYAEIAKALGRDEKAVDNAMCRIRAKLSKIVNKS